MNEWRERTAEEREAARMERERRRAEKSGIAGSDAEPGFAGGSNGLNGSYEWDEVGSGAEDEVGFRAQDEVGSGAEDEVGSRAQDEVGFGAQDEVGFGGEDVVEVPAGTRRIARGEHVQSRPPQEPRARRPYRRRRARSEPQPRRGRTRRILVRGATILVLAIAAGALWFLYRVFQPFHGSGHGTITVTIPAHEGARQVGDLLARDGVISSAFFFDVRATLEGDRGDLRAGTYRLKIGMSYGDVLTILTTPPPAAPTSELTIVEGDTRARIASLLRAQHVRGNYLAATRHSRLLNPRAYGAPRSLPTLEGFLFPATYQLVDPIKVSALVDDQLRTFKREFAAVNRSDACSKQLSPFDVLTIASIVQGEAQTSHDMPLIASVICNRLRRNMLLQMDSTTRYAVGNFTTPLTASQLRSRSPYNTRVHAGLPPGPINNPGMAAIQAAADPPRTSYLYFVAKVCGNGASVFSSTYAQFQRDARRYQLARQNRGGKSPTHC